MKLLPELEPPPVDAPLRPQRGSSTWLGLCSSLELGQPYHDRSFRAFQLCRDQSRRVPRGIQFKQQGFLIFSPTRTFVARHRSLDHSSAAPTIPPADRCSSISRRSRIAIELSPLWQLRQERSDEQLQVRTSKQVPRNSCGGCSLEVALLIADHDAAADVDGMSLCQFGNHAGLGLSAGTCLPVLGDGAFGVMRTVSELIDVRARICQLTGHPFVKRSNLVFPIESPRDA